MRLTFAMLLAASLLTSSFHVDAAPPVKPAPAAKSKAVHVDPLPTAKADPALVGRALFARALPSNVTAADRASLDGVVAELKAAHLEVGVARYRTWAGASVKPFTRDEAAQVGLWVFRESLLSRNEGLATAADRVRFFDERNAAVDDALALLKGAVIVRKPVLVARLVVLSPYVRETHGDEKRERQVSRDALAAEITSLEAIAEEVKVERDALRVAFQNADATTALQLQSLAAIMKATSEMRLGARAK